MMLAGSTLAFVSGAETDPCLAGTIDINITEADDLTRLSDVLNCTGSGTFNVTWLGSLDLPQVIEVSNSKVVTVTGSGFPTIRGALNDNDYAAGVETDAGSTRGMFSVSDGSTLSLYALVLDGGQSENGGAVAVLSSSFLRVSGCTFKNNNASTGGETVVVEWVECNNALGLVVLKFPFMFATPQIYCNKLFIIFCRKCVYNIFPLKTRASCLLRASCCRFCGNWGEFNAGGTRKSNTRYILRSILYTWYLIPGIEYSYSGEHTQLLAVTALRATILTKLMACGACVPRRTSSLPVAVVLGLPQKLPVGYVTV